MELADTILYCPAVFLARPNISAPEDATQREKNSLSVPTLMRSLGAFMQVAGSGLAVSAYIDLTAYSGGDQGGTALVEEINGALGFGDEVSNWLA